MNNSILIIGDSGTGKSSSIRNLPPEETFLINVVSKPLPFRGYAKKYTKLSPDGLSGNYYCTDQGELTIKRVINTINTKRSEIKYLIIDDLGYVAMNGFMRRALQKGYERFSEIGYEFNQAVEDINNLRDDLFCIATMHVETDKQGKTKPKTVGNMVDQYINIEGKFSCVFHSIIIDDEYKFMTNGDSSHTAKTSFDMFKEKYIDNDLLEITRVIKEFNNFEDINQ